MSFLRIGLTLPGEYPDGDKKEAEIVTGYLLSGLIDLFHLRKPDWDRRRLEELIRMIPQELHPRLRLHDHFSLTSVFNLGGVHVNSRNPVAPASAVNVSRSCHTIEELLQTCDTCWAFVTLSPVFDSISKPGYRSRLPDDLSVLTPLLKGREVVAMGGVTFQKIPHLQQVGFKGAALLGDLWRGV